MTIPTHNKGFTLLEVILSVAVASGVVLAVFSAFQLINGIRIRQERVGLVAWEAELIRTRLEHLVRTVGVDVPAPQQSTETLVLGNGDSIIASGGVLLLDIGAETVALSSSLVAVSSLSFIDTGSVEVPGLLRVRYGVTSRVTGADVPYVLEYQTTFYAR